MGRKEEEWGRYKEVEGVWFNIYEYMYEYNFDLMDIISYNRLNKKLIS
jgi:hypothetical protein